MLHLPVLAGRAAAARQQAGKPAPVAVQVVPQLLRNDPQTLSGMMPSVEPTQ